MEVVPLLNEHYLTLMYTCGHVLDARVNLIHASSNSIENEHIWTKYFLKERDAKACYESAETRKIHYERLIAKLRSENKNKRVQLAKSINVSIHFLT